MADRIQIRRDTAANWASANPVLAVGEQGYETDTGKMKIGNGSSTWNTLSYFADTASVDAATLDGLDSTDFATAAQGALADSAIQSADLATVATSGSYNDLSDQPSIPSITGLATETYVDTAVSNLVDTAPAALDTLNELAAALGDDADFAGSVTTSLAAKANTADLATVATTGAYSDLTGTPTLPSTLTDLSITDGTAGQVLSADGDGTYTFIDAASGGGGSFEAVASGSLSDGSTVVLNADGTVAAVAQEVTSPLLHTLDNPNAYGTAAADSFGRPVAISGNYAIFGAVGEDDAGGDSSGKAYIYNVATGALVHTLDNPNAYDTSTNDRFGDSVGISGNYAIVSSEGEDDAGGTASGKAYIFNVTTGALLYTLNNPNPYGTSANDKFAISVAISDNYAIVGAYFEDDAGGLNSGKAYIYNVTTGVLLHTLDNPNPYGTSADDRFGWSVAISGDYAIVGAYQEDGVEGGNSGKAYIFNVATGALVHTLDNPNAYDTGSNDKFGTSVSISDNYAIVGVNEENDAGGIESGKAYIFDVTTGALLHTLDNPNAYGTSAEDQFGTSVSISDNYAIISAQQEDDAGGIDSGKVYIYNVTTGVLVHTIDNPNAYGTSENDKFGISVAISDDYIIVGAASEDYVGGTTSGKAYIYSVPATTTNLTAENYAGIADAAYADAATATIQTAGSVDDAQSGLTPGQAYYVQANGTLGLTPGTPSVFAGTAVSATKLLIGKEAPAASVAYADVTGTPDLSSYATETYVDTAVSNLVDTAPDALNTLNELAAALNDDADFAGTVTTSLAAKANSADLATVATTGAYSDLTGAPTVPSDLSDLTDTTSLLGSGGGSFEAVASGSLSDGSTVVLNADGTVSVVAETGLTAGFGTATTFGIGGATRYNSTFDSNSNKVVIAYSDPDNSEYGNVVVGTVSGKSISFGTPVIFNSAQTWFNGITFDSNSNKVVIAYRNNGNSGRGTAIVGTVSGTTISFGSPTVFETKANFYTTLTFDSNSNKVVIAYMAYEADGNTAYGRAIVGTVSGTGISFGTSSIFHNGSIGQNTIAIIFDSNSNKVVIAYEEGNDTAGRAIVGTVSGTSISFGTSSVFHATNIYFAGVLSATFDSNSNKVVLAYTDQGNSYYGTAVVGTVSGTSISFGSPVVFTNVATFYIRVIFDPSTNKVVMIYRDNVAQVSTSVLGTVSGTSISFTSPIDFYNGMMGQYNSLAFDSNSNKVIVFYDANVTVYQQVDEPLTTNLTAENYAGIADAAYSDAATATIQTAGSVDDAQSGLTPGQAYYVQPDGTLGLTPGTPRVFAGVAASATKLLIGKEGPAADLSSYATETYVDTAVSNLVDTAPDALNTLNELAAALNDDANFAGTVTTSLSTKLGTDSVIDGGTV